MRKEKNAHSTVYRAYRVGHMNEPKKEKAAIEKNCTDDSSQNDRLDEKAKPLNAHSIVDTMCMHRNRSDG